MEEKNEDVYLAALAGLLHDIGKFAQRAGYTKGSHTQVGGEVVATFIPQQWRSHLYPVMGHHDHEMVDLETKRVALADRLSARERLDEQEPQRRQLLSVLSQLKPKDGMPSPSPRYWPLEPLQLSREALFPRSEVSEAEESAGYRHLWALFTKEVSALRDAHTPLGDLATYLDSMLLLLQRTTWCIPAAYYRSVPDVSLYDHSRMTAALAACLVGMEENQIDRLLGGLTSWYKAGEGTPPPASVGIPVALLVGGDLSGIQDFIYTIAARGATSALRGRSYYLQLLTEALARRVLSGVGMPPTNVVYQGGGNFYLLVPPNAENALQMVQQEISDTLWRHHGGELYLALAWQPLTASDLGGGHIGQAWETLGQQLQRAKQRRFAELGPGLARLFEPYERGGNQDGQCDVCGREHINIELEAGVRKCPLCREYEALGKDLRQARYLALALEPNVASATQDTWQSVLADLGMGACVAVHPPSGDGRRRLLLALDDDGLAALSPTVDTAIGRRFLVNVTPVITQAEIDDLRGIVEDLPAAGSVKPFSVMAAQAKGVARLGVLRMDVDNLGLLFSDGLGPTASLSRVASLSFAISLFFDGWVGAIAQEMNVEGRSQERGDTLYTIYSGGDDLFFVGSWDRIAPLAQRIRADLEVFAGHHPDIHASAGIVLIGGKYPLYQAAKDAGDAESAAKHLRWLGRDGVAHTKNAVTFLNIPLSWERFGLSRDSRDLDTVSGMEGHLVDLREGGAPHSVIRTLLALYADYREATDRRAAQGEDINRAGEPQDLYGPWLWRGYYQLKRDGKRYPDVAALAERLHADRFHALEWLGVAARWADLQLRGGTKVQFGNS